MPSLIDHTAKFVSDYCYDMKPYHDEGLLPSKPLPWPNVHEPSTSEQRSSHYQTANDSAENQVESVFGASYIEKPVEDSAWDYGYIHHPVSPYTSSMRPRNYPLEDDANMGVSLQPQAATNTPSSFFMDPCQQPSHETLIATLRLERHRDILTNPTNICQIQIGDEQFQDQCSSPSLYSTDTPSFNLPPTDIPGTVVGQEVANDLTALNGEESDGDGNANSEPYAQLIFRALKSAPGHRMVLKEIYEWFAKNTDKAKTSSSKGWQNSIRHNLSMNGAFKKVDQAPPTDEAKKGFIWVLEPTAVEEGVKSTTRYRKFNSNRKTGKAEHPAPQRQRSGAKGGNAAKKAAKIRRSARFCERSSLRYVDTPSTVSPAASVSITENGVQTVSDSGLAHSNDLPYYLSTPTSSSGSSVLDPKPYGYEDITGCSPHLCGDPVFYEDHDHANDSVFSYPSLCDPGDSIFNYGLAA